MSHHAWNPDLNIGDADIDTHHEEVFHLVSTLDDCIRHNDRQAIEKIILFLEHYVVEHFGEEETLMLAHKFDGYSLHHDQHALFKEIVFHIRQTYDEGRHSTHVVYSIRRFIDALVHHIKTVDILMAPLVEKMPKLRKVSRKKK